MIARYGSTKSKENFDKAIEILDEALSCSTSPPIERIKAGIIVSEIPEIDSTRAYRALSLVVSLLPKVSPRSLARNDQQFRISRFSGLAAQAASLALEIGESPYVAVRLLESGRGVLANLQLQVRSEIWGLRSAHPELARDTSKPTRFTEYLLGKGSARARPALTAA